MYCGANSDNDKRIGFFDLDAGKASKFDDVDPDLVNQAVEKSPKIIRSVDIGSMPLLFPAIDPSPEWAADAHKVIQNHNLHAAVGDALAARYADREESELVEAQIYGDFYSRKDKALLTEFHDTDWTDRPAIIEQLSDARLIELGTRLMTLYAPHAVADEVNDAFWDFIAGRWDGSVFYGESDRHPGNTYQSVASDLAVLELGNKFDLEPEYIAKLHEFFNNRKI